MNRTMNRVLRVFVCGTYSDLVVEREAVLDAIRKLQLLPNSMELFGARPDRPLESSLKEVERSDVVIVVVGYRYGTLIPERGTSISEAEYEDGYKLGKPCLVYLRDENVPILPSNMESSPIKMERLERFRATLLERHNVARFRDPADLAVRVAADLGRFAHDREESSRIAKGKSRQDLYKAWTSEFEQRVADLLEQSATSEENYAGRVQGFTLMKAESAISEIPWLASGEFQCSDFRYISFSFAGMELPEPYIWSFTFSIFDASRVKLENHLRYIVNARNAVLVIEYTNRLVPGASEFPVHVHYRKSPLRGFYRSNRGVDVSLRDYFEIFDDVVRRAVKDPAAYWRNLEPS